MSYESKRLRELKEVYSKIKDNDKYKKKAEWMSWVIDSAEYYFEECDYHEDLDNFNGFFEGCEPGLSNLLGSEDVERAIDCAELYIEHFGPKYANEEGMELQWIYIGIVECLLTMVMDYGI